MNEIRNLLLDCRAALRKADAKFEQTPLHDLLDDTIIELGQAGSRLLAEAQAAPDRPAAGRVAYAWQGVARELRQSHPALYAELSASVLEWLDVEVLDDPADEIAALKERVAAHEVALATATGDLEALQSALAQAVPLEPPLGASDAEVARQRLQRLVQAVAQGGGLPKAPIQAPDPHEAPHRDVLQAVAAGRGRLSEHHREWCMGEAMVLTGFQQSPVQLLAQGDAALAALVLNGGRQSTDAAR